LRDPIEKRIDPNVPQSCNNLEVVPSTKGEHEVKTSFLLVVALATLITDVAAATDNTCQKNFGLAVASCATSLSFLSPNVRAGAQKACVTDAKLAKDLCLNGAPPPSCLETCQTNYSNTINYCDPTYTNSLQGCGGDTVCEALLLQQKSDCIAASVDILNSCMASCSAP
jgi:hypothetical protein